MDRETEVSDGPPQASSAFSLLSTGVCVGNEDREIVACDSSYAAILKMPQEEIVGRRVDEITYPPDLNANVWLYKSAVEGERAFDIRKRYVRPDGSLRWVENRVSVMPSEYGKLAVAISRPIPAPSTHGVEAPKELRDYLADMTAQLAAMAQEAGLVGTADALSAAGALARDEGLP